MNMEATAGHFDDSNIQWRALEGFDNMMVSVFFVDEKWNRADFLIKFDANEKVLSRIRF